MGPLVPVLVLLLSPARALERAVETVVEGPRILVPQTPLLSLPLTPTPSVDQKLRAAGMVPVAGQGMGKAAVPAPLPQAAAFAGMEKTPLKASAASEKTAVVSLAAGKADGSDEGDETSGDGFNFDGTGARRGPLSALLAGTRSLNAYEPYKAAVKGSTSENWADGGSAAVDAGLALWAEQGVQARRATVRVGDRDALGAVVAAEKGLSPLNDLAYDLKRALGTTLAFVPGHDRTSAGSYASVNNVILLSDLDGPQVFAVALHEARHAWYSALLRRGEIRLFHLKIHARGNLGVREGARAYYDHLSLEELSTFPKTLKHLLLERAKSQPQWAAKLEDVMATRVVQLADVLKTTEDIANRIGNLHAADKLNPVKLSAEEAAASFLDAVPGMDWWVLPLARTRVYVPVPVRDGTTFFGLKKTRRSSKQEARAALLARRDALKALILAMVEPVVAYHEAVAAKDWAKASAAADALVSAVAAAEASWAKASPHAGDPGKSGS